MANYVVKTAPRGVMFTIIEAGSAEEAKDIARENWDELEWVAGDLEPTDITEAVEDTDGTWTEGFEDACDEDEDEDDEG